MPGSVLDVSDAAELAGLLQFLCGWLSRDADRLDASLGDFVDNRAYNTGQL